MWGDKNAVFSTGIALFSKHAIKSPQSVAFNKCEIKMSVQ